MTKYFIIVLFSSFYFCSFSQEISKKNLIIDINKLNTDNTLEYFSVAILNNSDSILCLLYPRTFNIDSPDFLNLCETDNRFDTIQYAFKISNCRQFIDAAIPFYDGVCILPFQAKIFTISLEKNKFMKNIIFDYFYKLDYSHSEFMKEKKKRGWYREYILLNKKVLFN